MTQQQPTIPPVVPTEGLPGSAPSPDRVEESDDVIVIQDTPVIDATKMDTSPVEES